MQSQSKEKPPPALLQNDAVGRYRTMRLPKHRELLGDLERMTTKHPIQALLEFDVTEARGTFAET